MSVAPTEGGLGGLLSECGAPPAVTSSLILAGWTLETFAACSDSMSGFDTIWQELLPDHPARCWKSQQLEQLGAACTKHQHQPLSQRPHHRPPAQRDHGMSCLLLLQF